MKPDALAEGGELASLLTRLADGEWHSGERLAESEGVTRAALAKRVERLRELDLDIEARHGLGYRIDGGLDRLDAAALSAAIPQADIEVVPLIDSTNAALVERPTVQRPQVLLAERQSAGRGRRGRPWASPFAANLYLSVAWRFPSWPPQLTTLPLVIGVAVAAALQDCGAGSLGIKWPNDLLEAGRKLGGILIEQRGEAGEHCRVVVGIGVNLRMTARQAGSIDQPWTTLEQSCAAAGAIMPPRTEVARRVISRVLESLMQFQLEGFEPFIDDYARFDLVRGQPVTVHGSERFDGTALGIDTHGALRVRGPDGEVTVNAGDVSLRVRQP